jgi:hypothetical protein
VCGESPKIPSACVSRDTHPSSEILNLRIWTRRNFIIVIAIHSTTIKSSIDSVYCLDFVSISYMKAPSQFLGQQFQVAPPVHTKLRFSATSHGPISSNLFLHLTLPTRCVAMLHPRLDHRRHHQTDHVMRSNYYPDDNRRKMYNWFVWLFITYQRDYGGEVQTKPRIQPTHQNYTPIDKIRPSIITLAP